LFISTLMESNILTLLSNHPLSHSQILEALKKQKNNEVELPIVNQCIKKLCDSSTISSHKFGVRDVEVYYINTSPPSSSSKTTKTNHLAGGISTSLKSRLAKKFVTPKTITPQTSSSPKKFKPPLLSSSSSSSSSNPTTQKGTKRTITETENSANENTSNSKEEHDPFTSQKNEIENLFTERKKLQALMVEKEQQLKSFLEQSDKGPYKPGDEDGRVMSLTKKWLLVCQAALIDLEKRSVNEEGKPVMTVAQIITAMQIDPKLVKYDIDTETFEE